MVLVALVSGPLLNEMKILILKSGNIGDIIVSIPALGMVRKYYSDCEVIFFWIKTAPTRINYSNEVLGDTGLVDSIYEFNLYGNFFVKILRLMKLFFRIVLINPNIAIALEPQYWSKRRGIFLKFCGVKRVIAPDGAEHHIPDRVNSDIQFATNVVDSIINTIKGGGIELPLNELESYAFEVPERCLIKASLIVKEVTPPGKRLLAIAIGSNMPSKKWPLDRYKAVIKSLVEEADVYPIFFGGIEDSNDSFDVIRHVGVGANFAGRLTIQESMALMKHCDAYLGNDTGPMHMASIMGVPCIAIFSLIDMPGRWDPYGSQGHMVIRGEANCGGCMLTACIAEKGRCLSTITSNRVTEACKRVLNESQTG